MEKNSRIYVAGHNGMAGSAILRCLKSQGYENIITQNHAELDLTRQEEVERFFQKQKPEYVFLGAAKVGGILSNSTYPAEFIYINLAIQINVLHSAWQHGVNRLIFLGSSCIYPRECPQPMKEEHLLTGILEPTNSPYAVAKISGIEMCRSYNRQYGTNFIPVMPTNLYGPNDNYDFYNSHVFAAMIRKFHLARLAKSGDWKGIENDESCFGPIDENFRKALTAISKGTVVDNTEPAVILWGTGAPYREFLHADDLADACVYLINHSENTDLINIGTGKDIAIKQLAEKIATGIGYNGKIIFDSTKPDGAPRKLLDVSKLHSLGWQAKIGMTQGIQDAYKWYKNKVASNN